MGREALCGKYHMPIIDRQFDSLTTHTKKKKAQRALMVEVHPAYTKKKKRDFRFRFFFFVVTCE